MNSWKRLCNVTYTVGQCSLDKVAYSGANPLKADILAIKCDEWMNGSIKSNDSKLKIPFHMMLIRFMVIDNVCHIYFVFYPIVIPHDVCQIIIILYDILHTLH